MKVELKILSDVYGTKPYKTKNGKTAFKQILLRENATYKKSINAEKVISVSQLFDNKRKILSNRCFINIDGDGQFTVADSYNDTNELIFENKNKTKIGF